MENLINAMQIGIQDIFTVLTEANWYLIYTYCFFMIMDLITGGYKATKTRTFNSSKMKDGLKGKVIELLIVFILLLLQGVLKEYGIMGITSKVILIGFNIKEIMSIFENWSATGNKIPGFVKKWLKEINEKVNETEYKEEKDEKQDS